MKHGWKGLGILLTVCFLCTSVGHAAWGYFDRGPVSVTVGQTNVIVTLGESITVTASVTPSSDRQLPGCGMAECPQTCGEKNCLNEEGECMCNGTEYQTYYADITTTSSNTSVATASFDNGVVHIRGVAPGEANITVTGMLRQYTQDAKTIAVTVIPKEQETLSSPGAEEQAAQGEEDTKGKDISVVDLSAENPKEKEIKVSEGGGQESASENEAQKEDEDQGGQVEQTQNPAKQPTEEPPYTIDSHRGPITFVPLQNLPMGKKEMENIKGKEAAVVFQYKDQADHVLYAWEFAGKDMLSPADIDMTIVASQQGTESMQKLVSGKKALFLQFLHEGDLPGKAQISMLVKGVFQNHVTLNLYQYDEQGANLVLTAEDLKVENGYLNLFLSHCSQYVLVEGNLEAKHNHGFLWGIGAGVLVVLLLIGMLGFKHWRKSK